MVTDPQQVQALGDPVARSFFLPFLGRENRIAEAAAEVGCSVNAMLYRVRRLVDIGLLELVREEPRAGRPVKVYRSVHPAYFVPFAAAEPGFLRQRVGAHTGPRRNELLDAYVEVLRRDQQHGRLFRRSGKRVETVQRLPDTDVTGRPVVWAEGAVLLTDEEAAKLAAKLRRWYAKAERRSGTGDANARPYLLHTALLPRPE